jgi:hypothetical protein
VDASSMQAITSLRSTSARSTDRTLARAMAA